MRLAVATLALVLVPALARAQDTIPRAEGVRIGITYAPGSRAGITVIGAPGALALDSARAIVLRDLDESDRFEMIGAPAAVANAAAPDFRALAALGSEWAVSVGTDGGALTVQLFDVRSADVRLRRTVALRNGLPSRLAVHQSVDDLVQAATGSPGIAATRLLYVRAGRIWLVDADGHGASALRTAGAPALSPAWAPNGRLIAYTAFVRSGQPLVLQDLGTGEREVVPSTEYGLNITPEFSRDGRRLAFAHGTEAGTDLYVYDVARRCCVQRLTAGRFADNLSPTWSPDGSRIAFISTRSRTPQLYGMAADGTGQEVLARFDYGATGTTSAPAWSPDGRYVAFHRDVNGVPQLFAMDAGSRVVRQLTGSGRNEDPTWAPDGRHLAFISARSGAREVWIVDVETGRLRQLTTGGGARLPAWSPRLTGEDHR